MAIKPRKYYQFVERPADTVSLKWKVFHTFLFVLIAANAFCSAYAFQNICEMVNYSCILYAKPYFRLKDVQQFSNNTEDVAWNSNDILWIRSGDFRGIPAGKIPRDQHNFKLANVTNVEVRNGYYYFNNATIMGRIVADVSRNIGTTMLICDSVLFTPLITFVIAIFFTAFLFICGRGGRSLHGDMFKQSWMYVYPILIVSCIMVIMSIVTFNTFDKGSYEFCARFERFTGEDRCTVLMNYFLPKEKTINFYFYTLYTIAHYSLSVAAGLWSMQLLCVILRMFFIVDFKLYAVIVKSKQRHIEFPDEEQWSVQDALKNKYGLIPSTVAVKDEEVTTADEATTRV